MENKDFDRESTSTLYYQLKEKFLHMILSNRWKAGQKIPSEMELCATYNVSRITVRKALEDLVRSEYLTRHQGKGTFVANAPIEHRLLKFYSFSEELKLKGMNECAELLLFDIISATGKVSNQLSLQTGSLAFKLTRLRSVDGIPYTVETSFIPKELCPDLTDELVSENGLYNAMRSLGIYPERAVEKFRATVLEKLEAKLLQRDLNSPAIHLERITYSGVNKIEYCSSIVRGDFFTYTVELKG